jgi:predicted nucleic acid-binding protein
MILVDTGALYALADRNNKNHRQAKKFYGSIVGQEILAISLPVLTESWLLLEARLGRSVANKVWGVIEGSLSS